MSNLWQACCKLKLLSGYLVESPRGIIQRNRYHLRPSSGQLEYDQDDTTRELPDFPRDFQMICQELQAYIALLQQRRQHLVHRGLLNSFMEQGVVGQCDLQIDLIYN
ncbi:hypothetical protein AVEN_157984-1 [Araneus ventricosus]|uniref:Uncharacterized protein n=1 Tax=Araneus ventricosus TaxID=182803 RepID=A0A4Y2SGZ6_ARAVE|nr:hypothetical protein AVEN_157984-1 [Araneus ventricosus]